MYGKNVIIEQLIEMGQPFINRNTGDYYYSITYIFLEKVMTVILG